MLLHASRRSASKVMFSCPKPRVALTLWASHDSYDDQVWWELEALEKATVVVVWIPRELETMPAFTTNVEFGFLVKSGKVVIGAPEDAQKMNYLKMLASKHGAPYFTDLDALLSAAIDKAARGGRG